MHYAAMALLVICTALLPIRGAMASPLEAEEVLRQSALHLPSILAAQAEIDVRRGQRQQAQGAFDPTLESYTDARTSGFYDGRSNALVVRQPLQPLNSQIYSRYRISDGTYPVYEDALTTQSGGEVAVGAIFSLLRNRSIDTRRAGLFDEELRIQQAQFDFELERLYAQLSALLAYWDWARQGMEYQVNREIFTIAQSRQSALEKEVDAGNRAAMFLVENQQNILKRESRMKESIRDLENKTETLSFFYRDAEGKPRRPSPDDVPDMLQSEWMKKWQHLARLTERTLTEASDQLVAQRPDIQRINTQIAREDIQRRLGENNIMPQLDVVTEVSQDMGRREPMRQDTESRVRLELVVPLQTNIGRGQVTAANARIRRLEFERNMLRDQLMIELERIANDIRVGAELMQLTGQEVSTAEALLEAEQRRFRSGASDFFLLNLREETLAEAKLRNIAAAHRYLSALSHYFAVTMHRDALGLDSTSEQAHAQAQP